MRRYIRVFVLVVLAYLIQATALPHLKINGVTLDLITIVLFTIGYTMGPYLALPAGVLCALILEVSSGDLPGLVSAAAVGAASFGAWFSWYMDKKTGEKDLSFWLRSLAPIAALMVFEIIKEAPYLIYFYLTGMDIGISHVYRVILAGLEVGFLSLFLFPLIRYLLLRKPEDTLLAKWLAKRRAKRKPKSVKKENGTVAGALSQGGSDA